MKKKKIAFVLPSLGSGGAERVLSILANKFVEDFDVMIITLYKCQPFYPLKKEINLNYCRETYLDSPTKWQSLKNHWMIFYNLNKLLKNHGIDVCIGFMTTANIYLSIFSKINNIPCIISERIHPEFHKLNKFWQFMRRQTYGFANVLVVQTDSIKSYFEKFIEKKNIKIIKNPLASGLIQKRDIKHPREQIILNVGRLDAQKNQDLLIKAFANVDNEGWKVVLVGEGELRMTYETLITSLNLEQKIELVGIDSNIDTYYNNASIFVFTSRYEGFPNALTEAMYFGMACISTDCPSGPSDLIDTDYNGFLIRVEDQEALEVKLKILMADSELRNQMGLKAMERTKEFEPEVILDIWKNLINEVLK